MIIHQRGAICVQRLDESQCYAIHMSLSHFAAFFIGHKGT